MTSTAKTPASLARLATNAGQAALQFDNAAEAVRGIRDRADAATGRGLRDDDTAAIRRYQEALENAIAFAHQNLAQLRIEMGRL